ncbi:hypothetical protein [Streptomyces agglomeratus]|uniref:hypothetical protein n=1 Tax=Streptomyces agglomeratus TaxID=285458 RepID=UPI00114CBB9C|nr:hypothetical protein [Streptomyces agglomeratus]
MQPLVEVVRVVDGFHDALGGGVEDAGERLVDTGGLEGLDDVVVVGAAAPDGVGEQVERAAAGASTAKSSPPVVPAVRSADVSTLLIRARAFDCCSMGTPIWCVGAKGRLW